MDVVGRRKMEGAIDVDHVGKCDIQLENCGVVRA